MSLSIETGLTGLLLCPVAFAQVASCHLHKKKCNLDGEAIGKDPDYKLHPQGVWS